jgi:hypothetical protein
MEEFSPTVGKNQLFNDDKNDKTKLPGFKLTKLTW